MTTSDPRIARIRALNDVLRTSNVGGQVVITRGIAALPPPQIAALLAAVRTFRDFDGSNDPYDEHDFGSLTVAGIRVMFKIDYFDPTRTSHSIDPADERITARVMTIMLGEEY